MGQSKGEKVFSVFNYILLSIIMLIMLYPFIFVFSASISNSDLVKTGKIFFLPKLITFESYKIVFGMKNIWIAYGNTIFYTVVGTIVSLFVTICGAYPLSRKRLKGRTVISFLLAFTMWFNAGIIPQYLNIRDFGLLDNRASIILAFACSAFYVILLRTYFQSIPDAIEESAKIDGANDITILVKLMLPLSVPSLLTIGLYYAVERWNGYFWAMILFKDETKIPLQVLLKKLVVEMNASSEFIGIMDVSNYSKETVIYSTIVVSILPIIMVYPFIQKYFVKGIMIGSVKG